MSHHHKHTMFQLETWDSITKVNISFFLINAVFSLRGGIFYNDELFLLKNIFEIFFFYSPPPEIFLKVFRLLYLNIVIY